MKAFAEHDGFPLFVLQTRRPSPDAPSVYLSAGIHGDEPAGPEGVLAWARKHTRTLQHLSVTIFPCLNPWGLSRNIRTDQSGVDLNRQFHEVGVGYFRALHQLIDGRHFDLAVALHEDYDGQGLYIYELDSAPTPHAPQLLAAARHILPADPRRTIDGRRFTKPGYLHRNVARRKLPDGPETIFLARRKAGICLTVETPSEFSLDRRIRAHRVILQAAVELVLRQHQERKNT
jgi:predicted deacylase